jgi:CRP/FNR family nitrogen fixation transcriptional regulator
MQVAAVQSALVFPPILPVSASTLRQEMRGPTAIRLVGKDEEVFAEGEPATHYFKVMSGVIRTSKLLCDGRRQIDAFHVPGDLFGIERGADYRMTAEAVGEARVIAYRRCALDNPATAADQTLARDVVMTAFVNLERAQEHMILLGRKSALEKTATFLIEMAARMDGARGAPAATLELPMSRADIADYLGLTIETVSRTLTQLERAGVIALSAVRRNIRLRNRSALADLAAAG